MQKLTCGNVAVAEKIVIERNPWICENARSLNPEGTVMCCVCVCVCRLWLYKWRHTGITLWNCVCLKHRPSISVQSAILLCSRSILILGPLFFPLRFVVVISFVSMNKSRLSSLKGADCSHQSPADSGHILRVWDKKKTAWWTVWLCTSVQ